MPRFKGPTRPRTIILSLRSWSRCGPWVGLARRRALRHKRGRVHQAGLHVAGGCQEGGYRGHSRGHAEEGSLRACEVLLRSRAKRALTERQRKVLLRFIGGSILRPHVLMKWGISSQRAGWYAGSAGARTR